MLKYFQPRNHFRNGRPGLVILCSVGLCLYASVYDFAQNVQPADSTIIELQDAFNQCSLSALQYAIDDLAQSHPEQYTNANDYRRRLLTFEQSAPTIRNALARRTPDAVRSATLWLQQFRALQREALTANPLISGNPILFVVRKQYLKDHHNTANIFQTGEVNTDSFEGGGALKTIDFGAGGTITTLLELPKGIVRDPEVHFDGLKIILSIRHSITDDYHLYEINADGSELKQLTSAAGVSDIDPLYLPDNSIVFSSTREPKFCMCNKHIMANIFRMEQDGANIHQIGNSTLFEGHNALMPDGRILYDRWEYVDRNFGDAQGLWTINPDGTNPALYWGNNLNAPGGVIDARAVSETPYVISVFSSCHDRPWGALALLDRRVDVDGRESVVRTWPPAAIDLIGTGNWDTFKQVRPRYEDPYPLNDKYFLCVRADEESEKTAIYLLDIFGNELLLHAEAPGCFDPMPVRPSRRPPMLSSRKTYDSDTGVLYVADVYLGTHMAGVERGSIKYLRVIEIPEKRTWNYKPWKGQGTHWPAMNWHDFLSKRILGTVPVEADGSACFTIPAGKFVYFQLLDANGMMVQSMRSGTSLHPNETRGCVGCHDSRNSVPVAGSVPLALQKPPIPLTGWYGVPRPFGYIDEVQPVFNKQCLSCHDYGTPGGQVLNLAPDRSNTFNTSYNELWRKPYIAAIGAGPSEIQPAYSWGSHASKLVNTIRNGHYGVQLSKEEFDRIVTWIDINAPYYTSYTTAYPDNLAGRSPLTDGQLKRLAVLTGLPLPDLAGHKENRGVQINFDRPALSPCLSVFEDRNSPGYQESLEIIQAGQDLLRKQPRADMAGFQPCLIDQLRLGKYDMRQQIEMRNKEAIRNGERIYDMRIH
jgi:hypothetical protein